MGKPIYSAKFDRWVAQAVDAGLVVEVEDHSEGILQSVTARISRPRVPEVNMLDVYRNRQAIVVQATRCFGRGLWSNSARRVSGADGSLEDFPKLSTVRFAIDGMAEDR